MVRAMRVVREECKVCKLVVSDEDVAKECDICEEKVHQKCTKFTESEFDRIIKYLCEECLKDSDRLIEWEKEEPRTREKQLDKQRNYYEVERIMAMRVEKQKDSEGNEILVRQFRVKWVSYPVNQSSWVEEKFMDGCIDLLQQWLLKHNKPLSEIKGLMGASIKTTIEVNEENWVDMTTIINTVNQMREYVSTIEIEICEWSQFGARNGIYFVNFEQHCFVVLYLHLKEVGYIADGANLFRNNPRCTSGIQSLLQIKLISCEFLMQRAVDHCGSSAVLIALEFLRAYDDGSIPHTITASKRLRERVVKRLHPHESATLPTFKSHHARTFHKCLYCARTFHPQDRKKYLNHQRVCTTAGSSSKS